MANPTGNVLGFSFSPFQKTYLSILAVFVAFYQNFIILNEETLITLCFVGFCYTIFSMAGESVSSSLDSVKTSLQSEYYDLMYSRKVFTLLLLHKIRTKMIPASLTADILRQVKDFNANVGTYAEASKAQAFNDSYLFPLLVQLEYTAHKKTQTGIDSFLPEIIKNAPRFSREAIAFDDSLGEMPVKKSKKKK
jgi:hypothetical protein